MRHGTTDWNVENKLQGQTDIPLNAKGRRMAEEAERKYKDVHLDICFSSPLKRAYETAKIVLGKRDIPMITDLRLREMCFGEYEGIVGYLKGTGTPIDVLFQRPQDYRESVGGAETFEQLFERTGDFLRERVYPELEKGKDVLIVGHGAMNSAIIGQIRQRTIEQFWKSGLAQCTLMQLL